MRFSLPITDSIRARLRLFFIYASNISLAALWSFFAYTHISAFLDGKQFVLLLLFASETLIVLFFLIREHPQLISRSPLHWGATILAVALGTLLRPGGAASPFLSLTGSAISSLGLLAHGASILSLGRSFGAVPARRTIRTSGMYRYIRHPMYASFFVVMFGYILANQTLWNGSIALVLVVIEIYRMKAEERFLEHESEYREYSALVRWRIFPGVF